MLLQKFVYIVIILLFICEQGPQDSLWAVLTLVVLLYRMCQRVLLFLSTCVTDDAVLLAQ